MFSSKPTEQNLMKSGIGMEGRKEEVYIKIYLENLRLNDIIFSMKTNKTLLYFSHKKKAAYDRNSSFMI
jgi:hypothetical protein